MGQLITESSEELYLFSSYYPYHEGSKNPIERFEGFLEDASESTRSKCYSENFERIFAGV